MNTHDYDALQMVSRAAAPAKEEGGALRLHVAAVYCIGEVRLITAARSSVELARALADHVRKSARHQLWPQDAKRVYRLLANKQFDAAVDLYFALVGGRWDNERLVVDVVDCQNASR